MALSVVFATHSTSVDNERGVATGWSPGELSELGRSQAAELGKRRCAGGVTAVFSSDLARAEQTARIAFADSAIPVLLDWRLRECDYGERTGMPVPELHAGRRDHVDVPYPGGESWRQAIARVGWFLDDLRRRWDGQRVLVIGHVATRWGFDHWLNGRPLEDLASEDFAWKESWEYRLP
ncbi:MAG: histidine phosphatase family protein [Nocardiopsaceae bacterium]|jgi:broad specificity phosphatase PhoE|nr:histidine phosphatase family protein [Nocardiopsaceae bacterium]